MPDFNPYRKWFGISLVEQPPHHYRLLGLDPFESDPDVIDAAAEQRMTFLQTCATGPHSALSQRLMNEVVAARLCLLDHAKKSHYDSRLRAEADALTSRSLLAGGSAPSATPNQPLAPSSAPPAPVFPGFQTAPAVPGPPAAVERTSAFRSMPYGVEQPSPFRQTVLPYSHKRRRAHRRPLFYRLRDLRDPWVFAATGGTVALALLMAFVAWAARRHRFADPSASDAASAVSESPESQAPAGPTADEAVSDTAPTVAPRTLAPAAAKPALDEDFWKRRFSKTENGIELTFADDGQGGRFATITVSRDAAPDALRECHEIPNLRATYFHNVEDWHLQQIGTLPELTWAHFTGTGGPPGSLSGRGLNGLTRFPKLEIIVFWYVPLRQPSDYDWIDSVASLKGLELYDTGVPESAILGLRRLRQLESFGFRGSELTDAGVREIATWPNLQHLHLHGQVTDAGVAALRGLTRLKSLGLSGPNVSDAGLSQLSSMTELESLTLDGTSLSDRGIKSFPTARLTTLNLNGTRVSSQGIKSILSDASVLKQLHLARTQVDDDCLAAIARIDTLTFLDLSGTQITNAGLVPLANASQMESLRLDNTKVSDVGLAHLGGLAKLSSLYLDSTSVTKAGLRHLSRLVNLNQLPRQMSSDLSESDVLQIRGLTKLTTLDLSEDFTDDGLALLQDFESLSSLKLARSSVTDAGIAALKHHQHLYSLDLSGTSISDQAMEYIAQFPALSSLSLNDTAISDAGIGQLAANTRLSALHVHGTNISPDGVKQLSGCSRMVLFSGPAGWDDVWLETVSQWPQLWSLHLQGGQITSAGIRHLRRFEELQELTIVQPLDDADLSVLADLPNLRILHLGGMRQFDGSCLRHLANSPNLQHVLLFNCELLDEKYLVHLGTLPGLRVLGLYGGTFSQEAIDALKRRNPKLTISGYSVRAAGSQ